MQNLFREKIKVSSYIQRVAKDFTDEELIEEYVRLILKNEKDLLIQLAYDFEPTDFDAARGERDIMSNIDYLKVLKKELESRKIKDASAKILDKYNELVIDHMNKYFRGDE